VALRHAAFLRGMNVGGHRITNEELRAHLQALGFEEVQTFRASGNVIFDGGEESDEALQQRVELGLREALGYAVPTFIRSAEEVVAIAEHQPFPSAQLEASAGKLQVAMLNGPPSAQARREVLALRSI
jgi:uncharacterized protein (DUF1697 family)